MANTEGQKKRHIFRIFRELCAIIFWCYLLGKVAIFDFDTYIINKCFPDLVQVLYYRLFLLAAIISILWLSLGKKRFPRFVLYVVAYPIVILIWKIPKAIFRHWSISIVFAPAIFEFITKFQTYFIINTLVAFSAILILTSYNKILLSISMLILATFLVYHLYSSFCKAYQSTVFSRLQGIISKIKIRLSETSFFQKMWDNARSRNEPKNDQEELQTRLSTLYIVYWCAEFVKEKVDHVLQSRKIDLYLIFTWFWTVFLTAVIYSLEYFSLYKILPNAFIAPFKPTYFSFLGFSFGKFAPSEVSAIFPENLPAVLLCYSQLACTVVIFVIFVFTILTAARERYKEDIYNIVKELTELALIIQEKFTIIFDMALADAEYVLLTHNATLVNGLRKLRGLPELSDPNSKHSKEPKSNVLSGKTESKKDSTRQLQPPP